MVGRIDSINQAVNEYFDSVINAKFIEMFGSPGNNVHEWQYGHISDVVTSVKYGTSKPANSGGQYKYLRMSNITDDGHLDLTDLKEIDIDDSDVEKYIVRSGDVLFNRTNSGDKVGKTCVFDCDEPMIIAGYIIRIRTNEKVTPGYLSAYLNSKYGKSLLKRITKDSICQSNINAKELQGIEILIPPIHLQHQYDSFVKQVHKSKLLFQQMVSKYDQLVKSRFIEMFGDVYVGTGRWEKQSFCDIVEFNPKKSELPAEDFDVSFVPMECVGTDNSMVPQCTKKKSEVIKGYTYFKNNDVVIAKITPCFENGKIAVAHDLLNGVGFGTTEFHVARPKEGISNPIWILNLLLLNSLKTNANQNMTGSAGQKRIQTDYFKRLMVEVPPIDLQNQFADFVRQVDKSKSAIIEGIMKLKVP